MTGKQRALIFLTAGVFAIAGIAAFGWIVWRTVKGLTSPAPATQADRRMVVTADKLVPLGFDRANPRGEILTTLRNFDGSANIQYDYSSSRAPDAQSFLSLSSSAFVFPQTLSAIHTYKMQQIAIKAGMKLAKLKLTDISHLLPLGDQRYAAIIERDGKPYGNLFLIRQGRVVHGCTIMGLGIENPADAQMLLAPVIEESKRQYGKK